MSMSNIFFCVYAVLCLSLHGAEQDRFTIAGTNTDGSAWSIDVDKSLAAQFELFKTYTKTQFRSSSSNNRYDLNNQYPRHVVQNLLHIAEGGLVIDINYLLKSCNDLEDHCECADFLQAPTPVWRELFSSDVALTYATLVNFEASDKHKVPELPRVTQLLLERDNLQIKTFKPTDANKYAKSALYNGLYRSSIWKDTDKKLSAIPILTANAGTLQEFTYPDTRNVKTIIQFWQKSNIYKHYVTLFPDDKLDELCAFYCDNLLPVEVLAVSKQEGKNFSSSTLCGIRMSDCAVYIEKESSAQLHLPLLYHFIQYRKNIVEKANITKNTYIDFQKYDNPKSCVLDTVDLVALDKLACDGKMRIWLRLDPASLISLQNFASKKTICFINVGPTMRAALKNEYSNASSRCFRRDNKYHIIAPNWRSQIIKPWIIPVGKTALIVAGVALIAWAGHQLNKKWFNLRTTPEVAKIKALAISEDQMWLIQNFYKKEIRSELNSVLPCAKKGANGYTNAEVLAASNLCRSIKNSNDIINEKNTDFIIRTLLSGVGLLFGSEAAIYLYAGYPKDLWNPVKLISINTARYLTKEDDPVAPHTYTITDAD